MNFRNKLTTFGVFGALLTASPAFAIFTPIASLSGINGIRFYEQTGAVLQQVNFTPGSTQMNTQLVGNLTTLNKDFNGSGGEFYDVFFSNIDGTFNASGHYITIEATHSNESGSSLNIGEVQLLFSGASPLSNDFSTGVVSYVPGTFNFVLSSLSNIGDNNVNTFTQIGLTDLPAERMRITVSFANTTTTGTPEPATLSCVGLALLGLGAVGARRRKRQ